MAEPETELVAGLLLAQIELVRLLEARDILEPGAYPAALERHLQSLPEERRGQLMYGPLRELIKRLEGG